LVDDKLCKTIEIENAKLLCRVKVCLVYWHIFMSDGFDHFLSYEAANEG